MPVGPERNTDAAPETAPPNSHSAWLRDNSLPPVGRCLWELTLDACSLEQGLRVSFPSVAILNPSLGPLISEEGRDADPVSLLKFLENHCSHETAEIYR